MKKIAAAIIAVLLCTSVAFACAAPDKSMANPFVSVADAAEAQSKPDITLSLLPKGAAQG
ncbi:MAG: hypothetical protein RR777_02730 [Christensenellaceae bacterium]